MTENPVPPAASPRRLRIAIVGIGVAAAALLLWAGLRTALPARLAERTMDAQRRDEPATGFRLVDRRGRVATLESYRGRAVFLNFWATWCAPCREEMPSLEALARSVEPASAAFVTLSVDETWEAVDAFFGGREPPFEVYLDPERKLATQYGTLLFPETYLVDAQGRLVYKLEGPRDWTAPGARTLLERAGARFRQADGGGRRPGGAG